MTKQEKLERAARARAALFGDDDAGKLPAPSADSKAQAKPRGAKRDPVSSEPEPSREPVGASVAPPVGTPPSLVSRKWDAPPSVGDVVFLGNERYFVEPPQVKSLAESVWIRIGDHRVPRQPHPNGEWGLAKERRSFYVHADELTQSPVQPRTAASPLPTVASVARAERARAGIRDTGDEIATLLRNCGSLADVYSVASSYLGETVEALHAKYDKLNPGQQRMVMGNRMRALWKKGGLR